MWIWIILAVVILLALMPIAMSFFMFHFIFYRPKRSKKIPKFYIDTPHYKVSREGMKFMDTLPVEDVYITSRDGLRLHGYLYPSEQNNKKFVIGIHGFKSYARPEYGPYIKFYHSLGYSMLLPDDRAHAPSEGKYIGFGVLDRLDCIDWAKYVINRFGDDVEIRLHGVSMGGATVLAASGEDDLPKQVQGIVADCGFTSAKDVLTYQVKHMMHMPVKYVLPLCEKLCKRRAGYGFDEFTPIQQVKKAKVPIMFVQGGQDNMVPSYMAKQLYDACSSKKTLLFVEEASHADSIALQPEKYHQMIHDFFEI